MCIICIYNIYVKSMKRIEREGLGACYICVDTCFLAHPSTAVVMAVVE